MIRPVKRFLARTLDNVVLFRSHEFRVTALDVVRRTPNLRSELSPLSCYLEWRHNEIKRLGLDNYRDHPLVGDIFKAYYGKMDRISQVVSLSMGTLDVPGDVAEFGTYKGHTAFALDRMLNETSSGKKLYLFDSFSGMPEITNRLDVAWQKGDLASQVEEVTELFHDSSRVHIVPGFFSESFPQYPDLRFAFCHVDADLYTSIQECIAYILPRLSVGGVVVFDDYGGIATPGAKVAVEECFGQKNPKFVPLPTGQAIYFARQEDGAMEAQGPL